MKKLLFVVAIVSLFTIPAFIASALSDINDDNIFDSKLSLDLKVNGSDGPVTINAGDKITISWTSEGAYRCRGMWSRNDIAKFGTITGRLNKSFTSLTVRVACIDENKNRVDDAVSVMVKVSAAPVTPILPAITQSTQTPPAPTVARDMTVAFVSEREWKSVFTLLPLAIAADQSPSVLPLFVIDKENGTYDFRPIEKLLTALKTRTVYVPDEQNTLQNFLKEKGYQVASATSLVRQKPSVVISESDFETAAYAAQYAALTGGSLFIFEPSAEVPAGSLGAECIGTVPFSCAVSYSRAQIKEVLARKVNTNKMVLANSTDIGGGQFNGSAILAPILAAAKNEHMVFTRSADHAEISKLIRQESAERGLTKGFLTLLGSPDVISATYTSGMSNGMSVTATTDSTLFTDVNGDFFPDLAVGRIYTHNLSASSSYIQRAIFSERLPVSNNITVTKYDYAASPDRGVLSEALAELFSSLGYSVEKKISLTERDAKLVQQDYQNKLFMYYDDHGWYNWLGLQSKDLKDIDGVHVIASGCSTCLFAEYKNPLLFCLKAISEGALSYMGMLGGGGGTNQEAYTAALFSGKSVGEAFLKMNNFNIENAIRKGQPEISDASIIWEQKWGIIGDPTLIISPSQQLPLSQIKKIDETHYNVDLAGYAIPQRDYRYYDHKHSKKWKTINDRKVLIFDNTRGFGDLYVYQQGVYPTEYHSNMYVRLGPVTKTYYTATVSGLENGNIYYLKEEQIGNERYLWVNILHYGFKVPEEKGFFTKTVRITLSG